MTNKQAPDRYTTVAIMFHWLIAILIIGMLAMGLYMTGLPNAPAKFKLFQLHKSIGITILALSLLRLAWRLAHRPPPLPLGMKRWERLAAHGTHWLFYFMMIAMPMTGWIMVSASTMHLPTVLYGVVTLPNLPLPGDPDQQKQIGHLSDTAHEWGAWTMIGLLCLHVGAALMHQFIRRDEVVRHMLPFARNRKATP